MLVMMCHGGQDMQARLMQDTPPCLLTASCITLYVLQGNEEPREDRCFHKEAQVPSIRGGWPHRVDPPW